MSEIETFGLTRRRLLAAGAGAVAVGMGATSPGRAEDGKADFLFVQSAAAMSYDAATGRLTLKGVSPVTVMFTDRPDRIAGNMRTADFVPFWSEGTDSFLTDPPNADISILEGEKLIEAVVVLRDPAISGDELSYTVEVLEGEMPAAGQNASVFIDIIGMPMTPLSFAGARRRAWRRAVYYR
ncbi:hypothetical protein H0I76_16970 [Limibaculum sp. M0105]|uniref:Uncharacterized protein n=1 Tax=Thermohalobaculum xanthum TaxID=2753746 RepID=A0A8J7M911_9RHOB|nr:hypothetical protein [Thermohalobaculum xanthum]MBK0400894.1 hypothetical protein [Thermohalobaculum xanthum]